MTKIWEITVNENHRTVGDFRDNQISGFNLTSSEPIGKPFPKIIIDLTTGVEPADYFTVGPMFAISEPLKSVFEQFDVGAEYFPLEVFNKMKAKVQKQYYYANLLDLVDAIDREQGEYEELDEDDEEIWPGWLDGVIKMVIQEESVQKSGKHLFRFSRVRSRIIGISEELAAAVKEHKLNGMDILTPDEWSEMWGE